MLYDPDHTLTREALHGRGLPEHPPWEHQGGSRWQPVDHGVLADTVVQEALRLGLKPVEEAWCLARVEKDLFGSIVFAAGRKLLQPKGLRLAVALRHSNAGRYRLKMGVGAQVMVCSNGMFISEHEVSALHVRTLDLPALVRSGLERFLSDSIHVTLFVEELRDIRLPPPAVEHLLVEAGRRGVLPWSSLGKVEQCWRDPPHAAFRPRTAWSLYNAFTEVAKEKSPPRQYEVLRGLAGLFDRERLRELERRPEARSRRRAPPVSRPSSFYGGRTPG